MMTVTEGVEGLLDAFGMDGDGFMCDGCSKTIGPVRYHCNQCQEFDYCAECHAEFVAAVKAGKPSPDEQFGHRSTHTMSPIEDGAASSTVGTVVGAGPNSPDALPNVESLGMRLKIPGAMAEVMRQRLSVLQEKTRAFGSPTSAQLGGFLRSCAEGLRGAGIREASAPVQSYFVETMADVGWDIKRNCSVGNSPPDFEKVVEWLEDAAAAEGEEAKGLSIEAFNSRAGAMPLTSLLEEYGAYDPEWMKRKNIPGDEGKRAAAAK